MRIVEITLDFSLLFGPLLLINSQVATISSQVSLLLTKSLRYSLFQDHIKFCSDYATTSKIIPLPQVFHASIIL